MALMIVESPTKIKTLSRILDGSWSFAVTRGHLYDLPSEDMGLGEDYEPEWVPQNGAPIGNLRESAEGVPEIYVASDPDREGEAIAWQVENLVLSSRETHRLRLESLSESEVQDALDAASRTDQDLVRAQWGRRVLDRLAGYKISPFLMNAFKGKKLSAGRVQSAVLAKIVECWRAVNDFEPETFYRVTVPVQTRPDSLSEALDLELVELEDEPLGTDEDEQLLTERDRAEAVMEKVENRGLRIIECLEETSQTNPGFPFNSSELIRRASSWFHWPAGKTMNVAQSLYEKGLITYHRSDSNRLSRSACGAAAAFIKDEYGEEYHQWRGGGGGDQEGHEAIRAKNPSIRPRDLHSCSSDQERLYGIIWQRYVQSQMTPATWRCIDLYAGVDDTESTAVFHARPRSILEEGFYRCRLANQTPPPDRERPGEDLDRLSAAEGLNVEDVKLETSETEGPRLYTEGSLIAMMKREGIGRPSTYSSTVERLKRRQYINIDDRLIRPTDRGVDVCDFLRRAIPRICDVEMTREMEEKLDEIARGEADWKAFVERFDEQLEGWIEAAADLEPEGSAETPSEPLGYAECPRCGSELILREGQYGEFVHCADDDCEFTSNPPAKTYRCPVCDRHMVKQNGSKSTVYHCLAHPECEGKRPVGEPNQTLEEFQEEAPDCPECGSVMERRKGRYGYFWGCPDYPDCEGTKTY